MDYPAGIDELKDHPVDATEMVLRVRRPDDRDARKGPGLKVQAFSDRAAANRGLAD